MYLGKYRSLLNGEMHTNVRKNIARERRDNVKLCLRLWRGQPFWHLDKWCRINSSLQDSGRWKVIAFAELTPLGQFEGEFLVDETERHDENEVDAGGRETGDDARLRTRPLVLEERDGDEHSVHDDRDDEDDHQHHLEENTGRRWRRRPMLILIILPLIIY